MKYKKYFRKTSLKQKGVGEFFLEEVKKKSPKVFLEVGVFHGVTARNVCELLYQIHKLITFIFTGKNVNFGNYSILTKQDVEKLYSKASLWSSFSGTVKKNLKPLNETDSIRGSRYFGPSQMSLFKLLIHSFSIIAVFKYQVFLRSSIMIILIANLNSYLGGFSILLQILIVIFNLLIFIVSLRENKNGLVCSHENLKDKEIITH